MAERYVSNSGSNGASGSFANPWQTFSYAQSASSSGDNINFLAGNTFIPTNINKSGITYDVYGGSEKPIISGFDTLTGWVSIGSGKWTCTNSNLQSTLKKITIDDDHQSPGRFVKFNTTDHGYLTIGSTSTTQLSNSAIGTGPNFVGGQLTFKSSLYTVDIGTITAQSGNTITFSVPLTYGQPDNGYGFVISNHPNTLTEFGEWSYNGTTKTVTMYFGSENPNSYTIRASRYANCITSSGGINNVQFRNIILEGSNGDGANIGGANTFTFDNVEIRQIGGDGINAVNHPYLTVENDCYVHDINNNGVWTTVGSSFASVDNNRVERVGLDLTLTKGGLNTGGGYGLHIPWGGSTITRNKVTDCAGVGIRYEKAYSQCNYNHVWNVLNRFADLGGIYNWNGSTNLDKQPGMRCIGNHVHDIVRSNQGTTYGSAFLAHGIYQDDHSSGGVDNAHQIFDNVVWNIEGNGFNLRNVESMHLQNNLAFACDQALRIVGDQSTEFIEDLRHNGNIFIAKESTKDVMGLYNNHGSIYNWLAIIPGTPDVSRWNNNVYGRPIAPTGNMFKTQNVGSVVSRTFSGLQSYLGWDQDSILSPVTVEDVDDFRLETNYSETPLTVDLSDGTYVDMYGVTQPESIDLPAYGFTLLVKTADAPPPSNIKRNPMEALLFNDTNDANGVADTWKGERQVGIIGGVRQWDDLDLSTEFSFTGSSSLRIVLREGVYRDAFPLSRSEIRTNFFGGFPTVMEGAVAFVFMVHEGPTGDGAVVISQMWDGGSPTLSIRYSHEDHRIFLRRFISSSTDYVIVPAVDFEYDTWYKIQLHYSARTDSTGWIKIFLNNEKIHDITGIQTSDAPESDSETPYWKFGAYDSDFGNSGIDEVVFFMDNINHWVGTGVEAEVFQALDPLMELPDAPGEPDVPPSIELLTPVNGKMYIYPTDVELTVNVTPRDNAIEKVDYYVNESLIFTVTDAPYSYTWENPTAGVKDIYAIVTDVEDLTSETASRTITVYNFIDGEGDFRMFLNEGTANTEEYGGETFVGGIGFYTGNSLIDNVSPDTTEEIFLTGRAYYNLNYLIPVPNGSYTVKTYHNEPYWGVNDGGEPGPNKRVFDIFLQDALVFDDFDIYVYNDSENTILTFDDIVVTDGFIKLDMVASVDMANLSALEIIPYEDPNETPVAVATSDVNSGTAPLTVMFTGDQSTDDVGIVTYRWEFGDGNGSDFANESHVYGEPGEYTATLTVTDAGGLTNIASLVINVNEGPPPAPTYIIVRGRFKVV